VFKSKVMVSFDELVVIDQAEKDAWQVACMYACFSKAREILSSASERIAGRVRCISPHVHVGPNASHCFEILAQAYHLCSIRQVRAPIPILFDLRPCRASGPLRHCHIPIFWSAILRQDGLVSFALSKISVQASWSRLCLTSCLL